MHHIYIILHFFCFVGTKIVCLSKKIPVSSLCHFHYQFVLCSSSLVYLFTLLYFCCFVFLVFFVGLSDKTEKMGTITTLITSTALVSHVIDHFVTQNTCLTLRAQHTTKQLFVSSCIQHDGSLQYQPGGKQCASGMGSSTSMWHLIPVCSAICFHDANRNQRHQRCLGPRFQVYLLVPTRWVIGSLENSHGVS